ncbi:MAG: hypothetical protein AAGD25_06435 [Cyanobacteria bacterium P01_F01_bin.150]
MPTPFDLQPYFSQGADPVAVVRQIWQTARDEDWIVEEDLG